MSKSRGPLKLFVSRLYCNDYIFNTFLSLYTIEYSHWLHVQLQLFIHSISIVISVVLRVLSSVHLCFILLNSLLKNSYWFYKELKKPSKHLCQY